MSEVRLYSIPEMDSTYQNAPFFDSLDSQYNWIQTKYRATVDAKISVDLNRTTVTIDKPYKELEHLGIDYISLVDSNNKRLYYFVLDYDYKTANATTLFLQLDVLQTYMFDITYMPSFVERTHVNRYKIEHDLVCPAGGTVDEGLEMGDMVFTNITTEKYRDKYIISSTTPLGKNKWNRPGGGGGNLPIPTDRERMDAWRTICRGV